MKVAPSFPIPASAVLPWILVMVAAWLAVGNQPGDLTLLVAGVGALFIFFPPYGGFPRVILILFLLLLLLAGTAFLPATWFASAFQKTFLDHGIDLPGTLSVQPWLSLEDFTLLLATLLWAWGCFETKLSQEQREYLVAGFLFGLGLIAINTIVQGTALGRDFPSWVRGGGQFENRNQTGDLLLMGGVFSFARGLSGFSHRRGSALLWILLTGIFMVAMMRNGSRAAIGLFAVGLFLQIAVQPRFRRANARAWPGLLAVVLLAVMIVAILAGPQMQERFRLMWADNQEGRWPIYRDVFSMVWHVPWCGVGLGNFEGVFNVHRVESAQLTARCLHPDSDWLWMVSELGVGGVIVFALLVVMTFRIYLWKTPFPSLTSASTTIAILFLAHTFFDVGGHRLGTVWSCLYLVGLGSLRGASVTAFRVSPLPLRLAGFLLLAVAILRFQSVSVGPAMPTRASIARVRDSLLPGTPVTQQASLLAQALGWAPLDWGLYYRRAVVHRQAAEFTEKSEADFNRALYLEQNSIDLPLAIGEMCRYDDSAEALMAWKELLRRAGKRKGEYFHNLYSYPGLDSKIRLQMTGLAEGDPDLEAIAVIDQNPSEFDWMLEKFLAKNPSLEGVSPALRKKLFDRWFAVGDQEVLLQEWALHPEWQPSGWKAYVRTLARAGRYQEAVAAGLQFMPPPHMPDFDSPQSLVEAERQYRIAPRDPFMGIRLYFSQVSAGANEEALKTLQEVANLPKRPAYIEYLLVKSLAATGQSEAAWHAMESLLDQP